MYRGKYVLLSLVVTAALLFGTTSLYSNETVGSGNKGIELAERYHDGRGHHWNGRHWRNWDGGYRYHYYNSYPYYYYSPGYGNDYYYYDPYYNDRGSGVYFRFGF